eukprot:1060674-Prymnesium_polylepis.1
MGDHGGSPPSSGTKRFFQDSMTSVKSSKRNSGSGNKHAPDHHGQLARRQWWLLSSRGHQRHELPGEPGPPASWPERPGPVRHWRCQVLQRGMEPSPQ